MAVATRSFKSHTASRTCAIALFVPHHEDKTLESIPTPSTRALSILKRPCVDWPARRVEATMKSLNRSITVQ
eukprot:scaffold5075_cov174-Amphora_coffeaeformis.AAC.3